MSTTLGSRLRDARERKGWSQTFVCRKLGISNSTLSGYERDYREPDADMISTFAEIYEVTTDYLLTGRNDAVFEKGKSYNVESELTPEELAKLEKLKHEEVAFKDFLEDPIEAQREFLQAYELFKEMKKQRENKKNQ